MSDERTDARTGENPDDVSRAMDPAVLESLVGAHRRFLGFVEKRVSSRAVAEEIVQEAFVRGMERGGALREGESATAWFYRVLRNAIVDHFRRRGTEARALEGLARELDEEGPEAEELREAVCGCVAELATTLKPEYADVLRQVEVEGTSVKDFASAHGISANLAGVRVHRAREALRKQVRRACGTCADHGCLDCTCGAAPAR
jgi:RNA polymerase sigma factor (sigma-70 family)